MRMQLFCVRGKVAQVKDGFLPQKVPGQTSVKDSRVQAATAWQRGQGAPALGAGSPMPLDPAVGASSGQGGPREQVLQEDCRRRCC